MYIQSRAAIQSRSVPCFSQIALQVAQDDLSAKIGCTKHESKQCWSTSHRQYVKAPQCFSFLGKDC
ncbi:hypothetical protein BT69DRAFT_646805 [Atractiella rhizophila]|nr:hypothetical protein BT69DRAFT_646805 [Atractiella rhizophila]